MQEQVYDIKIACHDYMTVNSKEVVGWAGHIGRTFPSSKF